jgi:hypothetical protein
MVIIVIFDRKRKKIERARDEGEWLSIEQRPKAISGLANNERGCPISSVQRRSKLRVVF